MGNRTFAITVLLLIALSVYLFASAPPPLAEAQRTGPSVPIADVLALVEAENDIVRTLWTADIVGAGARVGLHFQEDWRQPDVEAGPLPAQFLRLTADSLERNPIRLSLFLGSDFPINQANRFSGEQGEWFRRIVARGEPHFFHAEDTGLYTAMFPDVAVVPPCVTCHNDHADSAKSDWVLGDVMGATTWSYPAATVSADEVVAIVAALRQGFREAYAAYLDEVGSFSSPPEVGDRWPAAGYYLPAEEVFMGEIARRASPHTMDTLLGMRSVGEADWNDEHGAR